MPETWTLEAKPPPHFRDRLHRRSGNDRCQYLGVATTDARHRPGQLDMRKNVLVYQQGCEVSCSQPTSLEYKFRYRQGAFVLIGEEQRRMWRDDENGKEIQVNTGISVNYLAGKAMYFGKRGATRFERSLDFGHLPLVPLSGFDADRFDEQQRQIHALSGYVDAKLVLQFVN